MTSKVARWVPAAVVPIVIAAVAAVSPLSANAAIDLPDRTPAELIEFAASSDVTAYSGTVEQRTNLGIPALPELGGTAGPGIDSILSVLTSSYSAKVYVDGESLARLQILDRTGERNIVRNTADVWVYNSADKSALHASLSSPTERIPARNPGGTMTPADVARAVLDHAGESTAITVGADTRIAGRTAYQLVMTPTSTTTLVGSVVIGIDSDTGMPLSVRLTARAGDVEAYSFAFSDLTVAAPASDVFSFTPPAGSTVTEFADALAELKATSDASKDPPSTSDATPDAEGGLKPTVIGTGWDAVAMFPAGLVPGELTSDPMFDNATRAISGGRVLEMTLVTVMIADDGRVLVGAVPASMLAAAAAR